MKTPEELTALRTEIEALNQKLAGLTGDELAQVIGGASDDSEHSIDFREYCSYMFTSKACPFPESTRGHFKNCKDCPYYA